MSRTRRRYRIVDDQTRIDAIGTALQRIEAGDSFTAACRAIATQLDVSESAVRGWVNDSGKRPEPTWDEVIKLRVELDAATELIRRLSARLEGRQPCARLEGHHYPDTL